MKPNRQKEKFFLNLVANGTLTVTRSGLVKNNLNGKVAGKKDSGKYLYTKMTDPKTGKWVDIGVHRLVALVHIGHIPDGYEPNHKDGWKSNNRVSNLEIVTMQQNNAHARRTGLCRIESFTSNKGEDNGTSKLTEKDVRRIFKLNHLGTPTKDIAKEYSVHFTTVEHILNRTKWGHLKDLPERVYVEHRKKGSDNSSAKINEVVVLKIRRWHARGHTNTAIAKKVGISKCSVGNVVNRKTWSHVA